MSQGFCYFLLFISCFGAETQSPVPRWAVGAHFPQIIYATALYCLLK